MTIKNNFQEAECEKVKMDTKYRADASIADSSREYQMQKAHFDSEVNTKVSYLSCQRGSWSFGNLNYNILLVFKMNLMFL